ncbi:MAG: HlyD family efflux transporter periplasmic adaptor subunit [Chloroflexi bacterium]|jgi:multidrug efflux pump subunit AcrA (membrane-fusion protein)|nr:HlyD family efflux transporter periplasmic adaptor subunit [Chloroflexota bacterium]
MFIHRHKGLIQIATLLLFSLLLWGCDAMPWQEATPEPTALPVVAGRGVVSAEGRVAPLRWTALSFPAGGELGDLLVEEGDEVAQGDTLARLSKLEPLEAALSQARLERLSAEQALDELLDTAALTREQARQAVVEARVALTEARRALDDLDNDDFQEQLDDLNLAVRDARNALDDAEEELEEVQDLDPDNPTREAAQSAYDDALRAYNTAVYDRDTLQYQLDQARAAVDLAAAQLDDAQRQADERENGPDPDALALAEARLEVATAQVAAAQRALDNARLIAPFGGAVVDLHDWQPGETVAAGLPVVTLADFSAWIVETRDLTELDVVLVEPGQEVEVTPDALPDLRLRGTVVSIARVYGERSGDVLYTVRIRLDDGDPRLRWGMTVNAVFEP